MINDYAISIYTVLIVVRRKKQHIYGILDWNDKSAALPNRIFFFHKIPTTHEKKNALTMFLYACVMNAVAKSNL